MVIGWWMNVASAQQELIDLLVDGGNDYDWEEVALAGTTCGNGSPYRFYLWDDPGSSDLVVFFEGGGACWDYAGCTGQSGSLGAFNPNGIPEGYISTLLPQYISPIVNGADPGIPFRARNELATAGWDVLYLPYCTGDVHVGDRTVVYDDPTGVNPPLTFHHAGRANTIAAIDHAAAELGAVDKLLVSGFSAGGTAATSQYHTVRTRIDAAEAYLLNDSGPIHLAPDATSPSRELHDLITAQWGLDSTLDELPTSFDPDDFGSINAALLEAYPDDHFAYTAFSRDYNYSRFSYEAFDPTLDAEETITLWQEDQERLIDLLSAYPNTSWHVPWERQMNDSHAVSILTLIGSHACERMEPKRYWWELYEWPPGQGQKCYSEFVPFESFLDRWLLEGEVSRIVEPENAYNRQDIGMQIVGPLIDAAIEGA